MDTLVVWLFVATTVSIVSCQHIEQFDINKMGIELMDHHEDHDEAKTEDKLSTSLPRSAITFRLNEREESCFYEVLPSGIRYHFEFKVVSGGNRDVDFIITSPGGKTVAHFKKETAHEGTFDTGKGAYQFCFSNKFSTMTKKTVFFQFNPETEGTLSRKVGIRRQTVMTALESYQEEIYQNLLTVIEHQRQYRIRELIGRHYADQLLVRIGNWSLGVAVMILLTGIGQTLIMKYFFTERRTTIKHQT
ncbi:transmembrane emp24 domain-containing protein 7-like [Anneissia japonica]|uniref:transmembrane emp24 domain-containing protein 7-like n=1 Tax=Anneissia japonica TaxID=1529436 RepID=UPI001425BAA4|nr:transmembrane emp24 domain-containing protein 7-like [Anneissia japonica]